MKHRKKLAIYICAILLFIVLIVILLIIQHNKKLYDKSKPDIFEIVSSGYDAANNKSYRFYMVQNIPDSKNELKEKIDNFIIEKNIPACYEKPDNEIEVSFFFPSTKFPVSFEENKNKWKMDDYITHYFDSNGICTYRFSKTSTDYYYYDQNINKITNK